MQKHCWSIWQQLRMANAPHTVPVTGPDFDATFRKHAARVGHIFPNWLKAKLNEPLKLIGNDKPFSGGGHYAGLSHAHLGGDVSIVYKLEGKDPRKLKLFGFYSHDELGTGQPAKQKIQQKVSRRLTTQVFEKFS